MEMIWKPTGHTLRFDFRGLTLPRFLKTIQEVQHTLGADKSAPQHHVAEGQGIHYSINGSKECILTMTDEFEEFKKRITAARNDAVISLRPIDFVVSSRTWIGELRLTNTLCKYRRTSARQLQMHSQAAHTFKMSSYTVRLLRHPTLLQTLRNTNLSILGNGQRNLGKRYHLQLVKNPPLVARNQPLPAKYKLQLRQQVFAAPHGQFLDVITLGPI